MNALKPCAGSRKKSKRVGRGNGSWKGTYSGRGMKWQNARSGWGVPPWFEGWQTPLFRRIPKLKGFSRASFQKKHATITLAQLENIAKKWITHITLETLYNERVISRNVKEVKVVATGTITQKIVLEIAQISKWAKQAIEEQWWVVMITSNKKAWL